MKARRVAKLFLILVEFGNVCYGPLKEWETGSVEVFRRVRKPQAVVAGDMLLIRHDEVSKRHI